MIAAYNRYVHLLITRTPPYAVALTVPQRVALLCKKMTPHNW